MTLMKVPLCAQVLTQQSHKVCHTCLYAVQHARVAQVIRTERLIEDGDRVLLALSGGARSWLTHCRSALACSWR